VLVDYQQILAVKRAAQGQLLAIPGVHSVSIGAKFVAGKSTPEWAIQVYLVKKRPAAELSAAELIPAQINGVKTDVIEAAMPTLCATTFPDTTEYPDLCGGMQIQAGNSVTGFGTLGCIATTSDANVVAITNHHVVTLWGVQQPAAPSIWTGPPASPRLIIWGQCTANLRLTVNLTLTSTTGPTTLSPISYTTTAADTPTTLAALVATQVNGFGNSSITATPGIDPKSKYPQVSFTIPSGFTVTAECGFDAMWAVTSANTATFMGVNSTGMIVTAQLSITATGVTQGYYAVYKTVATDTLVTVAQGICQEIGSLGISGVTASNSGAIASVTALAPTTLNYVQIQVYMPARSDPKSELRVGISDQQLTISGAVDSDTYGVYPAVSPGGLLTAASAGGFSAPANKATLTDVTNSIFATLTGLHVTGATVTSSSPQTITVGAVDEVDCPVTSDVRVGQPTNDFCSDCSSCCGDRTIGRVADASLAADIALVQLDLKTTYKAEVLDVGYITGSYPIQPSDIPPTATNPYNVQKRGRTSGITYGSVVGLDSSGLIASAALGYHRFYDGAMTIMSASPLAPFSRGGDSGSAVLTCALTPPLPPSSPPSATQAVQVVGILFGGGSSTALATPIKTVLDRFQVQIATASAVGQVQTVTAPAAAASMSRQMQLPATARARPSPRAAFRPNWDHLRQIEQQIVVTPAGEKLAALVRKHVPETRRLINTNRRVATTWHRCGGPTLLNALVHCLQRRDVPIPTEIDGKPLSECLRRMQQILCRYGSPSLVADVDVCSASIAGIAGLTYAELLTRLQRI
jgi:hypothetical protein